MNILRNLLTNEIYRRPNPERKYIKNCKAQKNDQTDKYAKNRKAENDHKAEFTKYILRKVGVSRTLGMPMSALCIG